MGIAKLYGQNGSGGKINGIIEDYYAYAGENISAGDFVEFVNGVAGQTTETSTVTVLNDSTQNAGFTISAVQLDGNRVFIAHSGSSYNLYAMVVTINGATIIAGADTLIIGVNSTGREISVELLDNGNVFIAFPYAGNYYLYGTVCEISGTTITPGDMFKLSDINYTGATISTQLLDSGNVFIVHSYNTNYYLYAMVVTIDGTTITAGTDIQLSSMNYSGLNISAVTLDNNKVFIAHCYGSDYHLYGMVCSISGTTITTGTDTNINSTVFGTGYEISAVILDNDRVFIGYQYGNHTIEGIVCTISNMTINKGVVVSINPDTDKLNNSAISATLFSSNTIFIAYTDGEGDTYYLRGRICKIEGTSISIYPYSVLNTTRFSGFAMDAILFNGNIFIAHSYSTSYYLHAQMFGIQNNIPTNNVTIKEYETQVRKATTSDIYGVAKTSGTGGDSTGHKDIVSIYTAEIPEPNYDEFNVIDNGDFSKGTEGWTTDYSSRLTYQVINENSENVLKIQSKSASSYGDYTVYKNVDIKGNGDIYYWSGYVKGSANNPSSGTGIQIRLSGISDTGPSTQSTEYKLFSCRKAITSDVTKIELFNPFDKTANCIYYFKNIKCFNLTEMFGAGNEPTKEWCDENL